MTYYNIFFNNMRRNFKNYYIYLMSTIFSVVVYYLFASIKYNPQVTGVVESNTNISALFGFTGGIVLLFALIFIGYSNSFFVRKRKKEIALYSLMGMKKKRIVNMLFIENIIIAVISLILGIALGTMFSKLFIMALLRMLNHMIYVEFTFSMEAAKDTVLFFMIIFVVASINSYRVIKKIQLIELFSASKQNEKPFRTRPLIAIISFILVAFGYWLSQNMFNGLLLINMLVVLMTVILGTYGLFIFFLEFFTKLLKRRKKMYYKGNNLLAISNTGYRIRNHSVTLATIAILSATTITALGMAYSVYYDFNQTTEANYPFTYVYGYKGDALDKEVMELVKNSKEAVLIGSMKMSRAEIVAAYIGKDDPKFGNLGLRLSDKLFYHVLSNSQYNESMTIRNMVNDQVFLAEDECLLVYTSFGLDDYDYTKGGVFELNLNFNHKRKVKIIDTKEKALIYSRYSSKYIVVNDAVFQEYVRLGADAASYTCIKTTNQLTSQQLAQDIRHLVPEDAQLKVYYEDYSFVNQTYALLAFTAFFTSIVFLLSTGSIIYFKLITEANEEKERFTILKKIGVSKQDITWSIKKQMLLMFVVPLIVGLVHSSFALHAFSTLLDAQILMPVMMTMVGYSVIYFMYYVLTVNYYKKIIMK